MSDRMLSRRAGFTLAEVLIALVLTTIIGAAVTGAFISQSQFFDKQEKVASARFVSRGALNIMMSELRMVERGGGFVSATNKQITVRIPYMMGIVCNNVGTLTVMRLPADPFAVSDAGFSGYAFRRETGAYQYQENGTAPVTGLTALCTAASVTTITGGAVLALAPTHADAVAGSVVMLYQIITYEFKASTSVPGSVALWRMSIPKNVDEELVAPFDTTAKFRFFVNDSIAATSTVPPVADLNTITGIELTLDARSERPGTDGKFQSVPLRTSVFFKNRNW